MQQAEICIVVSVHHVFPLPLLPIGFLSSPGLYPLPLQGCHSQSSSWSHISWLTWLLVPSAQIEVTLWHWSTSQKKGAVGAKYPKMCNSVSFLIFVEVSKEISHILQDHPRALFFYISVESNHMNKLTERWLEMKTLQAATFLFQCGQSVLAIFSWWHNIETRLLLDPTRHSHLSTC